MDYYNNRIRKVAAESGIITTVAGSGSPGFSGDGGPATAAELDKIRAVALDSAGNLYIADTSNNRIRKVAVGSGIITTVAGNGSLPFSGDGGAATAAGLNYPNAVALDRAGNLYISSAFRIRKVAAGSGIITTVAGNGFGWFSGDGGAATAAGVNSLSGVAVDPIGNLYMADDSSDRVRAVLVCVTVNPAELSSPANGSRGVATSPRLAWETVPGAFRYDVRLDTVNPPLREAAADVTTLSFSPANLDPLSTYYWQVIAKGDPFCTPPSKASSEIRSFTTAGGCRGPSGVEGASP